MTHPNQARSDFEYDVTNTGNDSIVVAAESHLSLSIQARNTTETPRPRGQNYGQFSSDAPDISLNPQVRYPPPPYSGVGQGNFTTNESLATLESVARAVRNLDSKLNDVHRGLIEEIESIDRILSVMKSCVEYLTDIVNLL